MDKSKIQEKMNNITKINIDDWDYFCIGKEFEVLSTPNREASKYKNGNIPFVASGSMNNGVDKYVFTNEKLEEGNCITFSTIDCSSFYQKKAFVGRGHGAVVRIYHEKLNEKNALFLCTVLREFLGQKYDYNNQCWMTILAQESIKLPSIKNAAEEIEINWLYMEEFINNLQKECL